jgi:hypothetical protein
MLDILSKKEGCLTLRQIQWAICKSNWLPRLQRSSESHTPNWYPHSDSGNSNQFRGLYGDMSPRDFYESCLNVFLKSEFDPFKRNHDEQIIIAYEGKEIISCKAQLNFFDRFISSGFLREIEENMDNIKLEMNQLGKSTKKVRETSRHQAVTAIAEG